MQGDSGELRDPSYFCCMLRFAQPEAKASQLETTTRAGGVPGVTSRRRSEWFQQRGSRLCVFHAQGLRAPGPLFVC